MALKDCARKPWRIFETCPAVKHSPKRYDGLLRKPNLALGVKVRVMYGQRLTEDTLRYDGEDVVGITILHASQR